MLDSLQELSLSTYRFLGDELKLGSCLLRTEHSIRSSIHCGKDGADQLLHCSLQITTIYLEKTHTLEQVKPHVIAFFEKQMPAYLY